MSSNFIAKLRHCIRMYDVEYIGATTAFRDGWKIFLSLIKGESIGEGPYISAFEKKLSEYYQNYPAVTFGAGRMALYAILKAMQLPQGGEVILPGYTCIVTPTAIKHAGLNPVYVDVSRDTFNLTPEEVRRAITPKTCAILAQHTFGIPCDLDGLLDLSQKHGIPVIEDCAHAIGARYRNRLLGLSGYASFFSTQATKMISTSRGGYVITKDDKLCAAVRSIQQSSPFESPRAERDSILQWSYYAMFYSNPRLQTLCKAFQTLSRKLHIPWITRVLDAPAGEYQNSLKGIVTEPYPIRLGNLMSLAGLMQLERLEVDLQRRRCLADHLEQTLPGLGLEVPRYDHSLSLPSWPRYPFRTNDREKWKNSLRGFGLAGGNWLNHPIHPEGSDYLSVDYIPGSCPIAEELSKTVVNIPIDRRVTLSRLDRWVRYCHKSM